MYFYFCLVLNHFISSLLINRGAAALNSTGNDSNPGVSPLDIQAAASDTITPANQPTADNSLGLDIEYVPSNDDLYGLMLI
jgi:hypothetical protein